MSETEYVSLEELLEKAYAMAPKILELIDQESGRQGLVAVAALEFASGTIETAMRSALKPEPLIQYLQAADEVRREVKIAMEQIKMRAAEAAKSNEP